MGFLDGLIPSLGSVGGSFLGGLMDASNQESFMEKQDKINKENATIAYNRQRELTQDQALLHKRGMEQAGYNTAFGSNGNVTTSANVDQASPVSVPSPQGYGQQLSTTFGSFLQNSLVNAQRKNVDADTNAKNIDNATRAIKNALEIGKQKQDIGVSILNYAKDAFKFAVDKQYYNRQQAAQTDEMEQNAKRAEALQQIEAINAKFAEAKTEADINILKQQFENLKKVYDLTDAQIVTEKGKPRVQLSEVRKNNASATESYSAASLNEEKERHEREETRGQYLANQLDLFTQPDKLQEAFNRVTLQQLEMKRKEILNVPRTLADRWSREAQEAYNRIKSGHASWRDYKDYYLEIARENLSAANDEVKDYLKIIAGALPGSSSGNATTKNSKNVVTYSPQNY
jgi:hypothetical protein